MCIYVCETGISKVYIHTENIFTYSVVSMAILRHVSTTMLPNTDVTSLGVCT